MTMIVAAAMLLMPGAQQPPAATVQQQFEAAEALDAGTDKAAALAAWEALEKRVADRPRSRAIVLVRKSAALLALDRKDDAVAAARLGLANLPVADASLRADRFNAEFNLGRIAMSSLDYATAAEWFGKAEDTASAPRDKVNALRGVIEATTFTDMTAAYAALQRLDGLLVGQKRDGRAAASLAEARGILLLNHGDVGGAQKAFRDAVEGNGGMTSKIDIFDVPARSDAAIAYLLGGKQDEARRYMAMTGAGYFAIGQLDPGVSMVPPDCGGEAGLKPDDMAVVEFSVADDGTAQAVRPIYAAGGGRIALEFARAVRQWSWSDEQVKAMPVFLRYNARVELRCNLAFKRPSVGDGLTSALIAWGEGKGLSFADEPDAAAGALPAQRKALAALTTGGDTLRALPSMVALIQNPALPRDDRADLAGRALVLARGAGAPALAQLGLDVTARTSRVADVWKEETYVGILTPMVQEQPYASDTQSRAALRLMMADRRSAKDKGRGEELLRAVADDGALPAADPLKVGAMIRLASIAQARGDTQAARTAFAASGLAANQCALIDNPPKMVSVAGEFPREARLWGLTGWTRTQFDVGADGKVLNQRAIVSYPPFIFTNAGLDTLRTARFAKSYRPDGGLGCGANTQSVRFSLPK